MKTERIRLSIMISTPQTEEVLNFVGYEFVCGRNSDSTIFVNDPNFSRSHFKILAHDKALHVYDLGSSNGTYLNGNELKKDKATLIQNNDVLSVNNSTTLIKIIKFTGMEDQTDVGIRHNNANGEDGDNNDDADNQDNQDNYESIDLDEQEDGPDLTVFSQKIFNAAHIKVEQILSEANIRSSQIISDADVRSSKMITNADNRAKKLLGEADALAKEIAAASLLKITKDQQEALVKSNKKIQEMEQAAATNFEKVFLNKKKLLETEIDLEKKAKQEKLERLLNEEQKKALKQIEEERLIHAQDMRNASAAIDQKNVELAQLQTTIDEQEAKIRKELDLKIEDKKNEFYRIEKEIELEIENRRNDIVKIEGEIELEVEKKKNAIFKIEKEIELEIERKRKKVIEIEKEIALEINDKRDEYVKISKEVDLEIEDKKREIFKVIKELDVEIEERKNRIVRAEEEFEFQKKNRIQQLEVQVENRRFELAEELRKNEEKLTSSQKEFMELYENYKIKKDEHVKNLEELTKNKDQRIIEIKNLESSFNDIKNKNNEKIKLDSTYIASLATELEKNKKNKVELDSVLAKQNSDLIIYQKKLDEMRGVVKVEDDLIKSKKQIIVTIEEEINKMTLARTESETAYVLASNELNSTQVKLQKTLAESIRVEESYKEKNILLKNEFLQNKASLQEEMRKLKVDEEKRLQELTSQELKQINKIKEDTFRIVLDLEDSITKEICLGSSKVFASTMGIEKFREVGAEFEDSVRTSLKKGVLKLLQNELSPIDPTTGKNTSIKKKRMWKSFGYGALTTSVVMGSIFFMYERRRYENDPIRKQLEAEALEAKKALVKKFTPIKISKLGASFVDSVIYTEGFYELYSKESFRSSLMKQGSMYLYKKWQINEEKSIQSYAMIFSLVDLLHSKVDKIDPDFEKRDIDKMIKLEKETLGKLESIFGNEVRLEAALKFQARFYQEYLNSNGAVLPKDDTSETYPGE